MSRYAHRLLGWQRRTLYAAGATLTLTGALWLALHYGRESAELPHPMEAWLMKLHGLAGFAALFMFGVLAAQHIPHGWRLSARHRHAQQRGTGVALGTLAALLAVTGYALYYFAPEGVRPALGWAHALLGFAMTALVLQHRRGSHRHGREV